MSTVLVPVWRISGGPASRAYADVLLSYGVALIGPGDAGPWSPARSDDEFEGSLVRRFASESKAGDVLLLRTGIATIDAIGIVDGAYEYLNAFDDVNGWDLHHTRRVRWCRFPNEHTFGTSAFGATPPRCARVWSSAVLDFAERFTKSPPTHWQSAPLPKLPGEEPALEHVPEMLTGIVALAADLVPLLNDGDAFGEPPSEDELITHFIVPCLHALGWPPERIAVQWRWIDVALFRALPRTPENCCLVIEAKRLGAGVEGALDQAKGYVESLGVVRDVVVTDDIRYRMYSGEDGFKPLAYANFTRLKRPTADLFARLQRR